MVLQVQTDTLATSELSNSEVVFTSIWFWLALLEFFIIIILLIKRLKAKRKLDFGDMNKADLKGAQSTDINMKNLMNSITGSRDLYKELSKVCHPDRYVNTPNQKVAEEIFQEISRHKRNHEKLTLLKERAKSELNINF
jgi:hypothetical protein